jgi:hypothetical protein
VVTLAAGLLVAYAAAQIESPTESSDNAPPFASGTPVAAPLLPDSTIHGEEFKLDCARCHTPEDWRKLRDELDFEHEKETGFALRGAHDALACRDCHREPAFNRIGVRCADCHEDAVHRGELGFDCERCHSETDWRLSANFLLEHQQTRFPLVGRHALLDCEACHRSLETNEYVGLPLDCFLCHAEDYAATRVPKHGRIGFSTDCQECHSVADLNWSDIMFQHPSSFPLAFGHDIEECEACHTVAQPIPDGEDCYACHAVDYAGVSRPSHTQNAFPVDCRACHGPSSFAGVDFYDHSTSGFPYIGRHADIFCGGCHGGNDYIGLPADCYSCHASDYRRTEDPDHEALEFPTNCERCHTPEGWHLAFASPGEDPR